jgi:hypothetical protein
MLENFWRWLRSLFVAAQPVAIPTPPAPQPQPVAAPVMPAPPTIPTEPSQPKRKYDNSYIHLRRDLVRIGIYILDRFEHLEKHKADYVPRDNHLIGDLWGCDFLLMDKEFGRRMKGGDKWTAINATNDEFTEVMWPIDFAVANELAEDDETNESGRNGVQLYRIHTVTPKEVRGKVRQVAPKMLRYLVGHFFDDGHWSVCEGYGGLIGGKWVLLQPEAIDYPVDLRQARDDWFTTIMACAFTARYEWHVAFGTIAGGPRLLFPTNPTGCLHLFNNRDRAPGKTRREMLKHWVEQHYRDNIEDLAFVCHHLRGHTKFNWSGFGCELFVSQYDLEMNEHFKQQAKEWRSQRKHNRVRVHLKKKGNSHEMHPH